MRRWGVLCCAPPWRVDGEISMNTLTDAARANVVSHLLDGVSLRATARLTHVDRTTVGTLAHDVGLGCLRIHDELVCNLDVPVLELDELWSFVAVKQGHLREEHPPEYGDQYTYVALARESKLAVSYLTAKRNGANTLIFMRDLRHRILNTPLILTDAFEPYEDAVIKVFMGKARLGQVKKEYSGSRYVGSEKLSIIGDVDKDDISTSMVERQNLTVRMNQRRFTRKCNGFSKKFDRLRSAVALHFAGYNFVRVHETLKTTPAAYTGIVKTPWSVGELVERALTRATLPKNPPTPARTVTRKDVVFRVIAGGRR